MTEKIDIVTWLHSVNNMAETLLQENTLLPEHKSTIEKILSHTKKVLLPVSSSSPTERKSTDSSKQASNSNVTLHLNGHVLVVDDNQTNCIILSRLLENIGMTTTTAKNGEEALDQIEGQNFEMIIIDFMMPEMDGLTAVREIRERGYHMPIIIFSASDSSDIIDSLPELGRTVYLKKGSPPAIIYQTVQKLLCEIPNQTTNVSAIAPDLGPFDKLPEEELEIILEFVEHLPNEIQNIRNSHSSEDWEQLKLQAHKLASSGMLGYRILGKLASCLEDMATEHWKTETELLIAIVSKLAERITAGASQRSKEG